MPATVAFFNLRHGAISWLALRRLDNSLFSFSNPPTMFRTYLTPITQRVRALWRWMKAIYYLLGLATFGVLFFSTSSQINIFGIRNWLIQLLSADAVLAVEKFSGYGTLVLMIFVVASILVARNRTIAQIGAVSTYIEQISRDYARLQNRAVDAFQKGATLTQVEELISYNRLVFVGYLNKASQIFSEYTQAPCHVCVKVIDHGGAGVVTTLVRDTLSLDNRAAIDEHTVPRTYKDNTASNEIIGKQNSYFLKNDLLSSFNKGQYQNDHKEWSSFYNATLVVPITDVSYPKQLSLLNVRGFLCIDNKVGRFDKVICVNIARSFANVIWGIFDIAGKIRSEVSSQNQRGQ